MKRAELIPNKTYYMTSDNGWNNFSGYGYENLCQAAQRKKNYKVTILRTYLQTDYEKQHKTREVLVRDAYGRETWAPLAHIRGEFKDVIKTIYRNNKKTDQRGRKHAEHLRRKQEREVYRPALNTMLEELRKVSNGYVSEYDKLGGLDLKAIQAIIKALQETNQPVEVTA